MKPEIFVDASIQRGNVSAWRDRARGAVVRAVIKSDGYGWGFATIVAAIDEVIDGYYVSDVDEFDAVRPLTERPIATLAGVAAERIAEMLECNGIPTIATLASARAAAQWAQARQKRARVRLALRSAIGWAGITANELPAFAALLAPSNVDVEFSSHITDESLRGEQTHVFASLLAQLRSANVAVIATDLASSAPLAQAPDSVSSQVRLGVALFGARFGSAVPAACAIRVHAPLVEVHPATGQRTGYGLHQAPHDGYLAVVRCGYGDGFPRIRDERAGVLAVGMQFTTLHCQAPPEAGIELINAATDLDALAALANVSVHQVVTALGIAASRSRSTRMTEH